MYQLAVLISILSNTFARIDEVIRLNLIIEAFESDVLWTQNASREYLFQYTISTIEG